MTKKLEGKVALVTGASKGIGKGLALGLAQAGANVAINFKTDSKGADSAKQKIINEGGNPYAIPAGASDHPLGGIGYAHFVDELNKQEKLALEKLIIIISESENSFN